MASDGRDPITGAHIFSDLGASDIGVDPTLVSAQANDVGTRIIRANLAALDAYEYKRAGFGGHALDTGTDYVHDGTGWVPVFYKPASVADIRTGTWDSVSSDEISRVGRFVTYRFNARRITTTLAVGGAIANVPVGYRGLKNVWGFAWGLGGAANSLQIYLDAANNQVKINQALTVNQSIALSLTWEI